MNPFLQRYARLGHPFEPARCTIRPALRINTLRTQEQALLERLRANRVKLTKIPWLAHGYWYEAPFSLGATPEYLLGLYHPHGAASQLPAELLDPQPGEHVLDMAAAPGSKASHLAQLMRDDGALVCLDVRTQRLISLRNTLNRLGVTNTILYRKDARFADDLKLRFDRILCDAPCSGNWAADPDWPDKRSITEFADKAKAQRELMRAAWRCLKPGGVLVYSTCSLEPEEDEQVIDAHLREHPDAHLEPIKAGIGSPGLIEVFGKRLDASLSRTLRLWPNESGTEGFFCAKLRKKG